MTTYYYSSELYHHGVKGQKWGLRRFQNEDGSLTVAGREHYGYGQARADRAKSEAASAHRLANIYVNAMNRKAENRQARYEKHPTLSTKSRAHRAASEAKTATKLAKAYTDAMDKKAAKRQAQADYYKTEEGQVKLKARQEKIKKAAIAGAAVAATALAAYGAYKYSESQKNKKFAAAKEYGAKYYASMFDKFDTKAYAADRTVDRNMNYFHNTKAAAKEVRKSEHGYSNAGYSRSTRLNELADQYYNTAADAARRRSEYERSAQGFETKYNQYRNRKRK